MNELPAQAANFYNSIAAKEEATDNSAADFMSTNISEGKCYKNSSALEALLWERKAEKSDPVAFHMDMKKHIKTCEPPVLTRECLVQETASHCEDMHSCIQYSISSPIEYKSFIRQKIRYEIALDRECKKLEMVWTNRGLPVDRESLHSSASKDPFDLRVLNESLPSTSASEKKLSFHDRPRRYMSPMSRSLQKIRIRTHPPSCSPREERLSSFYKSLKARYLELVQRQSQKNLLLELEKNSATDEQNDKKVVENIPLFCSTQGQEIAKYPNFGPESAEMSLDDKQEEKGKEGQNSDAENNQQSAGLAQLSRIRRVMSLCSSWDSQRNWIADFQSPGYRAPLNSPIKKERTADKKDTILTLEKMLADARQSRLNLLRDQSKFRTLNSRRGVLSSDMDGSERENLSEQASRISTLNRLDSKERSNRMCLKYNMHKQLLMNMKESLKSFRSLGSRSSLSGGKIDLVVPD